MAGFIYLPVVTEETITMANDMNAGRLSKLVDPQGTIVGAEPVELIHDEVGFETVFIGYGSQTEAGAYVLVEGVHDDFVKLNRAGQGFTIEGGRISRVLAKSDHPQAKAKLEYGQTKDPYTLLAPKWATKLKGKHRKFGKSMLRRLTAADKLYVLAHGYFISDDDEEEGFGSRFVGASIGAKRVPATLTPTWAGGVQKILTADELARTLRKEGLPATFRDLHLFACGAGLDRSDTMRSFAQDLKAALAPNFPHILVYAYQGNLTSSYNVQHLPPDHDTNPQYEETDNPFNKGMTAQKHKGVRVKGITYPAKSLRVVF